MALSGAIQLYPQDLTVVSTVQLQPLGTRGIAQNGDEYIYAAGVSSCATGSVVTLDEALVSTLAVTGGIGRVGVAMAAVTASSYGWFQIYGKATVINDAAVADNALVYTSTAAGKVDDSASSQTQIKNAVFRSGPTASGTATVELNYPTMSIG